MKRISASQVGIVQGSRMMFSDFADGGPMWTGAGARESRYAVKFDEPFHRPPAVMLGMSLMDLDRQTNLRTDLVADEVGKAGFVIVFRTWGDTRIARIRVDWTAIGAVRDAEEWDVE